MFYWLTGNAMLIYYVTVNLRLHIPWFDVCWSFGVVGLEWYLCCWLGFEPTFSAGERP